MTSKLSWNVQVGLKRIVHRLVTKLIVSVHSLIYLRHCSCLSASFGNLARVSCWSCSLVEKLWKCVEQWVWVCTPRVCVASQWSVLNVSCAWQQTFIITRWASGLFRLTGSQCCVKAERFLSAVLIQVRSRYMRLGRCCSCCFVSLWQYPAPWRDSSPSNWGPARFSVQSKGEK